MSLFLDTSIASLANPSPARIRGHHFPIEHLAHDHFDKSLLSNGAPRWAAEILALDLEDDVVTEEGEGLLDDGVYAAPVSVVIAQPDLD